MFFCCCFFCLDVVCSSLNHCEANLDKPTPYGFAIVMATFEKHIPVSHRCLFFCNKRTKRYFKDCMTLTSTTLKWGCKKKASSNLETYLFKFQVWWILKDNLPRTRTTNSGSDLISTSIKFIKMWMSITSLTFEIIIFEVHFNNKKNLTLRYYTVIKPQIKSYP